MISTKYEEDIGYWFKFDHKYILHEDGLTNGIHLYRQCVNAETFTQGTV